VVPACATEYSSNTGFESADTTIFYFIKTEDGNTYFVMVNDKPRSGGGRMLISVDAPELGGLGVEVRMCVCVYVCERHASQGGSLRALRLADCAARLVM